MKLYRLRNRITGEFRDIEAESAQEACDKAGSYIDDTWVRKQTRGQYSTGWENVTKMEAK